MLIVLNLERRLKGQDALFDLPPELEIEDRVKEGELLEKLISNKTPKVI